MAETDFNKKLNELMERERELYKKMNMAVRAGASEQLTTQIKFMIDECKFAQQDLRASKDDKNPDDFNDFLSIG